MAGFMGASDAGAACAGAMLTKPEAIMLIAPAVIASLLKNVVFTKYPFDFLLDSRLLDGLSNPTVS